MYLYDVIYYSLVYSIHLIDMMAIYFYDSNVVSFLI